MTYEIIETEVENLEAREPIEETKYLYTEDEIEEQYRESLNDEDVVIAGITFEKAEILQELDPTAYNLGLNDFEDSAQEEEIVYICPECGEEYDDYDTAKFCCQDEYISKYDVDGELFDTEEEAEEYLETISEEDED